jgi:Protein of unknown function (DUF3429)
VIAASSSREAEIPRPILFAAIAGVLPFAAGALAAWLPNVAIPQGATACGVLAYAAVVLSFVSGAEFGPAELRGTSNALMTVTPPLAAWVALALPALAGVSTAIAAVLVAGLWSVLIAERGVAPLWTGKLASLFAAGAVLALLAILLRLLV